MTGRYTITIDKKGGIKIDAEGFVGQSCKLPDRILRGLGAVASEKLKDEYYIEEGQQQTVH